MMLCGHKGTMPCFLVAFVMMLTMPSMIFGDEPQPFRNDIASETGLSPLDPVNPVLQTQTRHRPPVQASLRLEAGMREDNLDWSIAGENNTPNILSELTWEHLKSHQLKLTAGIDIQRRLVISAGITRGWIYEGRNQDSDYLGDNRTLEFLRSNNNSDEGDILDLSLGLGPRLDFGLAYFSLVPMLGYSYHVQHLTITDGYYTIPPTGSFPGLDSTYETRWQGPWLGLRMEINAMQPLGFFREVVFYFSLEYHWVQYYAEADWNLRTEYAHPKSFDHNATGYGLAFDVGGRFFLSDHWALTLAGSLQDWKTYKGTDRVYLVDGTTLKTRLNGVNWDSKTVSVGISYYF